MVHETKFSLKISYSIHVYLAQLDGHQTCKPLMVSVLSFFFKDTSMLIFIQKCQIVVIYKILDCGHQCIYNLSTNYWKDIFNNYTATTHALPQVRGKIKWCVITSNINSSGHYFYLSISI